MYKPGVVEQNIALKKSTVKPPLRGNFWDNEKVALYGRRPLKRGSIHMKFSVMWQEKGDLLTEVAA